MYICIQTHYIYIYNLNNVMSEKKKEFEFTSPLDYLKCKLFIVLRIISLLEELHKWQCRLPLLQHAIRCKELKCWQVKKNWDFMRYDFIQISERYINTNKCKVKNNPIKCMYAYIIIDKRAKPTSLSPLACNNAISCWRSSS